MYAYIKGTIDSKFNDYVIIEAYGVGYQIFMSLNAIEKLGEVGTEAKVYTHHHVREDNISLYGFLNLEELRMFELLIGVSGIGAKSAIAILSNISPSKFALSVITNDIKELTRLPGIGTKSAQRIILELKDKLKTEEAMAAELDDDVQFAITKNDNAHEAISALQVLGYPVKDATKAVTSLDTTSLTVEEIIKKALIYFTKS